MNYTALRQTALRLVETAPFHRKEVEKWVGEGASESHSLHTTIAYPEAGSSHWASHFINKYSHKGELILDPFCRSGTVALEAALLSRSAIACDNSPLATRITKSKLQPADITEVTLFIQQINLRRPVDLDLYRRRFLHFFDTDTFREIVNLRTFLQNRHDRVARFVELLALSLLHGHSAGFFSVYTFPQISISPSDQELLNNRRCQLPDYRAVTPRILRKAASILRDGIPSVLQQMERHHRVFQADARNLAQLPTASVDLVVTTPPAPHTTDLAEDFWLRSWFSGLTLPTDPSSGLDLHGWLDYMNEVLLELARVLRPGSRCILDLRELRAGNQTILLDEELVTLIDTCLGRFFECECSILRRPPAVKLKDSLQQRESLRTARANRVLVLRRR